MNALGGPLCATLLFIAKTMLTMNFYLHSSFLSYTGPDLKINYFKGAKGEMGAWNEQQNINTSLHSFPTIKELRKCHGY